MNTDRSSPADPVLRHTPASRLVILSILVLSAVLSGCASNSRPVRTTMVPYSMEQIRARDEARQARYRIRTGDVLKAVFKYEKELNQETILVLPDGYVNLPGIGSVRAAGRTISELDTELITRYGREYRNPDLSIVIVDISDPEVYVMGNVERPGLHKLPENGLGILQAVAAAGGFTESAEKSSTVVLRAGEDGFIIRSFDLSHIEESGIMDLSYFDLQPYDIVYVPQSKLGDLQYVTNTVFGSAKDLSSFFWDIYALANIDKIDRLVR